ncbi:hypothetical protein CRG98_013385 [Punica granatum]|uniref:non-specific serine/threonine protein kinase n=1 Tax=Punica granatum TaxID=22663 RepID=A0A2I0KCF3_PUNGR|nr:hypothetical protein CRG98_013385 [Punica granatum]
MEFYFAVLALACLQSFVLSDFQGEALASLMASLNATNDQLMGWNPNQVDPCTWSNVKCDPNNNVVSVTLSSMNFSGSLSPKIGLLRTLTTLTLRGNGITGAIPEEFGNLTSLTNLDLENNRLTGQIPASLGNLEKLKFLSLSQNNLIGSIPDSLSTLPSLVNLQLDSNNLGGQIPPALFQVFNYNFTGNKLNCGINLPYPCASESGSSSSSRKSKVGIIIGVVGGLVLLLLCGMLVFLYKGRQKGYRREAFVDVAGEVDGRIPFGQLKRFAWRELQIATDNFCEKSVLGQGGFGKVYKGVLADGTKIAVKRLTDFESPGGDAAFQCEVEMIKIKPGEPVLDWPMRKKVALGAARGLEYLHEHCNPKIIHRDVKAANVLLDEDFEAVVGDFGLAKLVDLVTGQRAIDFSRLEEEDDVLLLDHVKKLEREKKLDAIVDRNLNKNYNMQEVEMMIKVALLCTQASPEERPPMSEVRWEEWQHIEVTRRQEYERLQRRFDWGENSVYNQDAIELSGGR